MSNIVFPKKYKLVSLGEQSVGKTSLLTRFMYDHFENNYQATIGIDFLVKTVTVRGKSVRLQLWDTAGQERFRSLIPCYIRESDIALVVYDVTNKASFKESSKWIQDVREERRSDVVIMLVGNKADLQEKREVTSQDGEEKAKELDVHFIETSAKTGYNVNEMFSRLTLGLPEPEEEKERRVEHVTLLQSKDQMIVNDQGSCYTCG